MTRTKNTQSQNASISSSNDRRVRLGRGLARRELVLVLVKLRSGLAPNRRAERRRHTDGDDGDREEPGATRMVRM